LSCAVLEKAGRGCEWAGGKPRNSRQTDGLPQPAARTSQTLEPQSQPALNTEDGTMPIAARPHEYDGSYGAGRKPFRSFEMRRNKNGNGNGHHGNANNRNTKAAPPESTNAENFYYLKQMNSKTPMVIVMTDGEEIRGWIEWYDKACLKVNREGAPNLLIQKHWIKYLFKAEEAAT
jgi:sRNA-binding regulator protein Hfq